MLLQNILYCGAPLYYIMFLHISVDIIQDPLLIGAPERCQKRAFVAVAGDAVYNYVLRQPRYTAAQKHGVFFKRQGIEHPVFVFFGKVGAADNVQQLELYPVSHPADMADRPI